MTDFDTRTSIGATGGRRPDRGGPSSTTSSNFAAIDTLIVFIEGRSYGSVTRCGRIIWTSNRGDDRAVTLVPIRRDNASRIARPCRICGADDG